MYLVRIPVGLQSLKLNYNELGWAGLEAFTHGLPVDASLLQLELASCQLEGTDGGQAVGELLAAECSAALEELHLSRNMQLGADGAMALIQSLPQVNVLRTLGFDGCGLQGSAGGRALAALVCAAPALERLHVGNNPLGQAGIKALAEGFPEQNGIKELRVFNCGFHGPPGGRSIGALVRKAKSMEVLDVIHNALMPDGLHALARALPSATALKHVDVAFCELDASAGGQGVAALTGKALGLQGLCLAGNTLGSLGVNSLASGIPDSHSLKEVNLQCCGLRGATGGRAMAALWRRAPRLTRISLTGNKGLGNQGVEAIAHNMPEGSELQEIALACCGLKGTEGGKAVATIIQQAKMLEIVGAADQPLGLEGVKALVSHVPSECAVQKAFLCNVGLEGPSGGRAIAALLRKVGALRSLSLEDNGLGASGVMALAQGLAEGVALSTVHLELNGLRGRAGGRALAALCRRTQSTLRELGIDGNELGPAGVQAMLAELPVEGCRQNTRQ